MRRWLWLVCLGVALAIGVGEPSAQAQTQTLTYTAPKVRNVLVDWCAHFARDCGKVAADMFCQQMQYQSASAFSQDPTAGQRGLPTLVIGDGTMCTGQTCSGFRSITCTRTATATTTPPRGGNLITTIPITPTPTPTPPPNPPPTFNIVPPTTITPPPTLPPAIAITPFTPPTTIQQPPATVQRPPVAAPPLPPGQPPPPALVLPIQPPIQPPLVTPIQPPGIIIAAIPRPRPPYTAPATPAPIKPKIAPIDQIEIAKAAFGEIHLVEPKVEPKYGGEIPNPFEGQVPFWDDETVFKWKPSNPGMADTFEMRFFTSMTATTPVASLKVPGSITAKATSLQFQQDLLKGAGVPAGPQDDFASAMAKAGMIYKDGNLFWEVAGYRGYAGDGVAKSGSDQSGAGTIQAQVAVSERWPLRMPDRANGYGACGPGSAPEINPNGLVFKNLDALASGRPLGIDYLFDQVRIDGAFSLAMSPYASHPKDVYLPIPPGGLNINNVGTFTFDNLFIDWGDGTVEPLSPSSLQHYGWHRSTALGLPGDPPAQHQYTTAGSYYVRIFQVSEKDAQKVDVSQLNFTYMVAANQKAAASGKPTTPISGGYYQALAGQKVSLSPVGAGSPGVPSGPAGLPAPGGTALGQATATIPAELEVANRAYVIYCHHVVATERMDERAFGDLLFYSGEIFFDDSHAIDKARPIAANVAACDQSAKARVSLDFIGKGTATLTWKIDGVMIGGVTEVAIGPSPARSSEELAKGAPPKAGTWLSDWVPLLVTEAMKGGHQVTVEVAVKEKPALARLYLRPSQQASPVSPVLIKEVLPIILATGPGIPKKQITVGPRTYTIVDSAPGKPCHLRFLVAGGAFDVFIPDPAKVTVAGGLVSGSGNMLVPFANQGDQLTVPITFSGWQLATNAVDVTAGSLAVTGISAANVNLPGLAVALKALNGTAGTSDGEVQAGIDVAAEGGGLRSATGAPQPPKWSGEQAKLAPDGDWYRAEAKTGVPESMIGWSGFLITADKVALDFSAKEGAGPGGVCGIGGADWIGAKLTTANIEPNLFHLDAVKLPVTGWVVGAAASGNGLCGDLDANEPVPLRTVGEGTMAIHHLTASVRAGFLNGAKYTMEVGVPILGVTLKGDGTLVQQSGKEPSWNLNGLTGPATDRALGTVRLQASNYVFGTDVTGWRVSADTKLTVLSEGKTFTTINASGVRYGLDGRVHFDDSALATTTIGLGGAAALGQTPIVLKSATLTGPGSGAERLSIQVATNIHLSDSLPSPAVTVAYGINKTGDAVTATGPKTTPFSVEIAFPPADPGVKAKISPQYVGDANAGGAQSGIKFYAGPGEAAVDLFSSSSPVQSAFVLGYVGSSDYWMTLTSYDLGPTGTPLVSPIINLFGVNGGLGYHVDTDKFVGMGDIKNVTPSAGKPLTFLAGITAGTPDQTTFTIDGQLKMTGTEKIRMDFTSWLLKSKSGSVGDFTGFFEYGGGSFDGQIWGGLSLLSGAVQVSADPGAVDMHFGSGAPWHIYLGRKEGPKITTSLLNLGGTSGYMMLSGDGYFVGSGANINLGGSIGPFSATVKGSLDTELGIEPSKPRVSGSATGSLAIKGCAFGLCVGPDASVTVSMAALPIEVSAEACFEVDLLLKSVGACGSVSL